MFCHYHTATTAKYTTTSVSVMSLPYCNYCTIYNYIRLKQYTFAVLKSFTSTVTNIQQKNSKTLHENTSKIELCLELIVIGPLVLDKTSIVILLQLSI